MGDKDIIDKRAGGFGYDLRIQGGPAPLSAIFYVKSDTVEDGAGEIGVINLSTNYILTGTYNDTTKTSSFYRDGIFRASNVAGGPFLRTTPSTGAATIGDRSYPDPSPHWFNGIMDEVIVYNKDLGLSEVSNNYNASN